MKHICIHTDPEVGRQLNTLVRCFSAVARDRHLIELVGLQCKQHSGNHSVVRFEDLVFFLLGVIKFNCAVDNVDSVPAAVVNLKLFLNHFFN